MHLTDEYPIKFVVDRLPPPVVADLNGDSKKEVLVATHDAKIQRRAVDMATRVIDGHPKQGQPVAQVLWLLHRNDFPQNAHHSISIMMDPSKEMGMAEKNVEQHRRSVIEKEPIPHVPTITNYTKLWWLPNVVAYKKEGIEVVHLASGRIFCKVHRIFGLI